MIIYVNKNHLINLKKSFHSSVKYLYSQTFLEAFLTLTSVNGLIKFPVNSSYCRQFEYLSNSSSVRVLLKCNCCYLIREGFKKKSIMENSILGGQVGGHQSGTVKFFSALPPDCFNYRLYMNGRDLILKNTTFRAKAHLRSPNFVIHRFASFQYATPKKTYFDSFSKN